MSGSDDDPFRWLEDVTGERALAFARAQNERSAQLGRSELALALQQRLRGILDASDKIPFVSLHHGQWYNFWQDATHVRGIWRRTTWDGYLATPTPWETVLDVDELARQDGENWVLAGIGWLHPDDDRVLLSLSRGGGDATVVREFDPIAKAFVPDGFTLPEGKHRISWKDRDTVYVGTDFGPGSLTQSGYPRIAKEWRRGTPLTAAVTVFEGEPGDVAVAASRSWDHGRAYDWLARSMTFYTSEEHLRLPTGTVRIDVPADADIATFDGQLLVTLRSDWTTGGRTWPAGALLGVDFEAFLAGDRAFTALWEPAANRSLAGQTHLRTAIVLAELVDVQTRLLLLERDGHGWRSRVWAEASPITQSLWAIDREHSDEFFVLTNGYLTPSTLSRGSLTQPPHVVKQAPPRFAADGHVVTQHFARSRDGTRVPYFLVAPGDLAYDGTAPTLLYGYGGFEVSLIPSYSALTGAAWLERGGLQVIANIRGGGEYGPKWHQAALRHERQRAFDDFIAVAADLIARRVTSPAHLGILGGSNGGLLMGVMLTQRPDLFAAVVGAVPLLDMRRYHKLLAGASWMAEYGDPDDPADWAVLGAYSPYHQVRADRRYPPVLWTTSTRDDRVHPGHARKMVARMLEQGHDVLYYENLEGGHGGAADHEQVAYLQALQFAFLWRHCGGDGSPGPA